MPGFVRCGDCMKGAPYNWCCKLECGKRDACSNCEAACKGVTCPNTDIYFERKEKEDE